MTDTSGFYKNDNGTLLYASSAVIGTETHLVKELKDTYEYPVDGWTWFDTEDAARTALNITVLTLPEPPQYQGVSNIGMLSTPPVSSIPVYMPPLPTGPINI